MADTNLSRYAQVLRLLAQTPKVSAAAVQAIEQHEAKYGIVLPAAVRDWYALEGAVDMLAQRTGACGPNSLDGLLKEIAAVISAPKGSRKPRVSFYGPWRVNTGYEADLMLDGSDDPAVYSDSDDQEKPFSKFVLDIAWWKTTFDEVLGIHVSGEDWWDFDAVCGPTHLRYLTERFEELPREPHPAYTCPFDTPEYRGFRFFRAGGRVAVATKGDPAVGDRPAVYQLSADTEDNLFDLYESVKFCHGLAVELCTNEQVVYAEMKTRFVARFRSAEVRDPG
jgi:hypothetical protein